MISNFVLVGVRLNDRTHSYVFAILILLAVRLTLAIQERRAGIARPQRESIRSVWRLVLASFLVLFAELAFIRWIAVEARIFAYFKNLALLLCFLGFGTGCALAGKPTRWKGAVAALFGLLLVVRMPWDHGRMLENLSQNLGAAADMSIWDTNAGSNVGAFVLAAFVSALLFLMVIFVFIPLGQEVGRQMNLTPKPLTAYSLNLSASLGGILVFLAASRLRLPPEFWLGIVVMGFALLQRNKQRGILMGVLLLPLVLLLHEPSNHNHYTIWTPYQQIEFTRIFDASGEMKAGMVQVNHVGYQLIINMSHDFLSRHPKMVSEPLEQNPYNVAFRFAKKAPSVMVVGAGTGNDVAAALRHDSSSVDAVEIDPSILEIGKREHPEHPYDSSRVTLHLTDARAFLKRSTKRYDLIVFGLLDSHTQLSDYANMRIDNFVYTEESFQEAKARLKPDGVLFLKFEVRRPWMARRLKEMLASTFGKEPLVFNAESTYAARARCFVISRSDRVQEVLNRDAGLAAFVARSPVDSSGADVPVTTDDWPYLYQRDRTIPRPYWSISAIIFLLAIGLYRRISGEERRPPSLFFFWMGAGFLLLETQVISRLALFFGTTWQVNGIVISAMLAALLLANVIVERRQSAVSPRWNMLGLLAALAFAFWFPFERIGGSASVVGVMAVAIFFVPVVFAGMLFSGQFRNVKSQSSALAANLLGAVAGGLLENCSLIFGMRALLLIAMGIYALAWIALVGQSDRVGKEAAADLVRI